MVLHAGLMIVSWKCDATRKRESENIFDWSFTFLSRGVFAPTRQFKLHSINTGPYDYYKFDLYPSLLFLAGWWDVGQLSFVFG